MADFRKLLLALIAGALLFTTVASAVDYGCNAGAVPTLVRSEGIAELTGDVLLNCSGDIPSGGILANIRLKLTANITSNPAWSNGTGVVAKVGDLTEAMLILDGGADGFRGYSDTSPLTPFTNGTQNLFQAVKISDDEIEWQGVWLAASTSTGYSKSIRLTNVRGNVQSRGDFATIYASINITGSTTIPVNNNLLVVADTRPGLVFSVDTDTFRNCEIPSYGISSGYNDFGDDIGVPSGLYSQLNFTEGFGSAFRPKGTASSENTKPGGGYRSESGFNPGSLVSGTYLVNKSGIGQASYGTRLFVRLTNVPSGVTKIWVPSRIVTPYGMDLRLVSPNSSGATGSMSSSGVTTLAEVSNSRFAYEVYSIDAHGYLPYAFSETVEVPLFIDYALPGPVGTASASGTLAPISTVYVMDWGSYEPRFVDKGVDKDLFSIGYCLTILLYPYTTNQANFDTGLAIANTSKDPLSFSPSSRNTKAQAGTCTLYYFGNTSGGPAPAAQTTPEVKAGGHFVMQLSGGGGVFAPDGGFTACASGACVAPLFQGYIFALCNFQYAHGYAFISDYGSQKLAQGYLALIVPDVYYGRPAAHSDWTSWDMPNPGEQLGQ